MITKNFFQRAAMTCALLGLAAFAATAQTSSGNTKSMGSSQSASGSSGLSASDQHFVKKAAAGGMAEVQLGQLATEKASSDDVKKFGQRMVDDHTKANEQLKQLASSKGVDLPQDLDAKDKATMAQLSKLSGAAFDRAYMRDMVTDHMKDVAEFQRESKMGKDADVKSFAAQTLPTLQDHLKQAKSVAPSTSKGAKSSTGMGTSQ